MRQVIVLFIEDWTIRVGGLEPRLCVLGADSFALRWLTKVIGGEHYTHT